MMNGLQLDLKKTRRKTWILHRSSDGKKIGSNDLAGRICHTIHLLSRRYGLNETPYMSRTDCLSQLGKVQMGGILLLVVPIIRTKGVLRQIHEALVLIFGINETLAKVREKFYWVPFREDVERWFK